MKTPKLKRVSKGERTVLPCSVFSESSPHGSILEEAPENGLVVVMGTQNVFIPDRKLRIIGYKWSEPDPAVSCIFCGGDKLKNLCEKCF
jgi:hypothetical protein